MAGEPVTPHEVADAQRKALAAEYLRLSREFNRAYEFMTLATVDDLARSGKPVRHMHASTRSLENALDSALTAL